MWNCDSALRFAFTTFATWCFAFVVPHFTCLVPLSLLVLAFLLLVLMHFCPCALLSRALFLLHLYVLSVPSFLFFHVCVFFSPHLKWACALILHRVCIVWTIYCQIGGSHAAFGYSRLASRPNVKQRCGRDPVHLLVVPPLSWRRRWLALLHVENLKELLHISAIRFLFRLAKIRDEPRISTSVAVVDVPCPSYLEFRRAAKSKKSSS